MHDSILLAYARAMWSAQKLESSLKLLFSLHNVISGISKAQAPLTDEEFEKLMTAKDGKPLGDVIDSLFNIFPKLGLSHFPEDAKKLLDKTRKARNFVAHSYFISRVVLTKDPEALPTLIAELEWYSELFNSWDSVLDRWIDMLIKALGFTDDDMKELQNIVDEGPPAALRQDLLTELKNQLAQIGITASPPLQESTT
jgi:hypothetical protein